MNFMNNAAERLLHWANEKPDKLLLITPDRRYSYEEFTKRAFLVSSLLNAAGYVRGQRVALFLEEYDQFLMSMFGIWFSGGVVIPLNTTMPQRELDFLIAKAKPSFILVANQAACPNDSPICVVLPSENDVFWSSFSKEMSGDKLIPLQPDDLAMIMFTSGTTGLAKGVCQTLACISNNAGNVAMTLALRDDDLIFINIPPYFTSAICHFLTLMANGGGVAAQRGFLFGEGLLAEMDRIGCTGFGGAPAHLIRVVEPIQSFRTHTIRFWISSGDHLPLKIIDKLRSVLPGVRLFNMYGLTEVGGRLCIMLPEDLDVKVGSVGRPICDMTVVAQDPDGNIVTVGDVGELYVTGSLLMQGYLDDPATTAYTLTDHGLRTGDFGMVDEAGYVWVSGRKDDIIKCGGEKVSTVQIQQALMETGYFYDVAVIAMPDEILGHVTIACVVPLHPEVFKISNAFRELKTLLPRSLLPARIVPVKEIPRTGSGKAIVLNLKKMLEVH